jgi:hypothetical protein
MNPHTGYPLPQIWEATTQFSHLRQNLNEENLVGEPASPSISFNYTKGASHEISAKSDGEKPLTETMNVTKRKSSTSLNKKLLFLTPQTPRVVNNKKLYYIQGTYPLLDSTKPDTGTYGPISLITGMATPTIQGEI